jgi:signal transduction histidine kinase
MASLQTGRMSIIPRPVDLKQILNEACEPHVPLANDRGVQLECPMIESVEVYADPERVLQVLGNLLGNAVKFCEQGDSVKLLADAHPDEVLISVRGSGPGINREDLPKLFDPFRASGKHERAGTGLGLFIAKKIVEQHGGRLWVETQPGDGATFTFTLPRPPTQH